MIVGLTTLFLTILAVLQFTAISHRAVTTYHETADTSLVTIITDQPNPDVDWSSSGPYAPPTFVGANGGIKFSEFGAEQAGKVVRGLDIWLSGSMAGIQLFYSDGSTGGLHGYPNYQPNNHWKIIFEPGERVTNAVISGNKQGNRAGRIVMDTSKGKHYDIGHDVGQDQYPIDVGSGILVGVTGRAAVEIDALGFVFLTDVDKVEVSNIKFTIDPISMNNTITEQTLTGEVPFENQLDKEATYTFQNSVTRTNTNTFTQGSTTTWGVQASIEAGFFDIAKTSSRFSWQQEKTASHSQSTSTEIALTWSLSGTLPPKSKVVGKAFCQFGQLPELPYTSTVKVYMKNQAYGSFTFSEKGTFTNAIFAYAEATVSTPTFIDASLTDFTVTNTTETVPVADSAAAVELM